MFNVHASMFRLMYFLLAEDQRQQVLGGPHCEQAADDEPEPLDVVDQQHSLLKRYLPRLPADCVRFSEQPHYSKPSDLVKDMIAALPTNKQLNEDQRIFMFRFAEVLDVVYDQENNECLPPEKRNVYHMLLLGQGGSGKTHIVQNIIFPVIHFVWPAQQDQQTLMVVAAKNAQAKNISTEQVRARTLHGAALLGVQALTNSNMAAGSKQQALQQLWSSVRVLVVEEISMVSALLYNMLDFRAMLGRCALFKVTPQTYTRTGHAFGRVPIVLHLGDFFQLRPTAQLSLLDDLDAKDEDGNNMYTDVPAEVQHAQKLFGSIPDVFELRGTMRFKQGDPLIDILHHMRFGLPFPDALWLRLAARFASEPSPGVEDPRFEEDKFRKGYGMSIYWASLGRMMCRRALLDAVSSAQPLVLLQAADHSADLDKQVAFRFLNRPNPYRTGHMHGIFPCHVGMQVRLIAKLDAEKGMIQDTIGTIMDFEFHSVDRAAYSQCRGGEIFSPQFLPSGIWLSVEGYQGCRNVDDLVELCSRSVSDAAAAAHLARSFWFLPAEEIVVKFSSTQNYQVKRCGFRMTHASFFTSTGSQGLTLRKGTVVDCARLPEMDDDNWWLHLYVMFSRVTSLDDLLLLRPPSREVLERGPPKAIREQVAAFQRRADECRQGTFARMH